MAATYPETVAAGTAAAVSHAEERAGALEDVATLSLDAHGMICDCNRATEALFKCRRSELVWRHVSMLLPELAEWDLTQNGQPNPRLRFLSRIGRLFHAVARDGERFASEVFLNLLNNADHGRLSLIVRPAKQAVSDGGPLTHWN